MAETPYVEQALRDLARGLDTGTPSPGLAAAVMERVAHEPVPTRSGAAIVLGRVGDWTRTRLRWVVGVLLALLGAGVVASPVGAQVADWLDFGGVLVRLDPDAPTGTAQVPGAGDDLTLGEAEDLAGFRPSVPARLGLPEAVSVSPDGVVTLSWSGASTGSGTVRLDQFADEPAPHFWKLTPEASPVRVGDHEGLWFPEPHEVVFVDEDGREQSLPPRLAAQTLVWLDGERTFRLEGELTRGRAVAIALSTP